MLTVCLAGWFGVDCNQTCHCHELTEDCQITSGSCESGCAQNFTGDTCQGNVYVQYMMFCIFSLLTSIAMSPWATLFSSRFIDKPERSRA